MSTFIRRYSRYLNEKAFAYRQMAFDFGRVKKGYSLSFLMTMPCCVIVSAMLLICSLLKMLCWFSRDQNMPPSLVLALRRTHIPQGSRWCVGWTQLPPAWRWMQIFIFTVWTESRDEYRVGYYSCSESGRLCFAGRHKVPLATQAGIEKYKRRLQNRDQTCWWIQYLLQVQTGILCVDRQTEFETLSVLAASLTTLTTAVPNY